VFGAFCVLKKLAEGLLLNQFRFYRTTIITSEQIHWASRVNAGIQAILDSSWVNILQE